MQDIELLYISRAIEFLNAGMDISSFTKDMYKKIPLNGSLVDPAEDSTFAIKYEKAAADFLELYSPYIIRTGRKYQQKTEDNVGKDVKVVDINYDIVLNVARILKKNGICTFSSIDDDLLDPDLMKRLEDIDKTFDYTKRYDCDISKKLTIADTDNEVKTLLALSQYPTDLAPRLYEYSKVNHPFVLSNFKDFEVRDNRIIIPLSEADKYRLKKQIKKETGSCDNRAAECNAVVISKNIVDYFFCSYGNEFQSCFALNSDYGYWYGYVPFVMSDASFVVYATTGAVNKTAVISGSKYHNPNMLFRTWGYADEEGCLMIDKKYRGKDRAYDALIHFICEWLTSKFKVICDNHDHNPVRELYNNGKDMYKIWNEYNLKFYSDSLKKNGRKKQITFEYGDGSFGSDEGYLPDWKRQFSSFIDYAKTVTEVGNINLSKEHTIINGKLIALKRCPTTNLLLADDKEKHAYSKYFTAPVTNLAVLTYMNGTVFTEELAGVKLVDTLHFKIYNSNSYTRDFTSGKLYCDSVFSSSNKRPISLKSLKEWIKGNIKETSLDAILLKIVEEDKVTMQVFKNIKG